jgi:small subunit ribosomal protein S6
VIDYEILLLFDAELPDERQSEIVTRTRELIERGGGTFERHDVWGRRKLAYEIDHKPEGSYHLLTFQAEPGTLDEVSRVLKITDGVLRHLAVKRPKPGPTPSGPPPSADREQEYAERFEQSGARFQPGSGDPLGGEE